MIVILLKTWNNFYRFVTQGVLGLLLLYTLVMSENDYKGDYDHRIGNNQRDALLDLFMNDREFDMNDYYFSQRGKLRHSLNKRDLIYVEDGVLMGHETKEMELTSKGRRVAFEIAKERIDSGELDMTEEELVAAKL